MLERSLIVEIASSCIPIGGSSRVRDRRVSYNNPAPQINMKILHY